MQFSSQVARSDVCSVRTTKISQEGFGKPVTTERLAQMMLELQAQGALNINLVTPLHFSPHIIEAVTLAKRSGIDSSQ